MQERSQHPSFTLTEDDVAYFEHIPPQFLVPLKLLHYEKMNYREIEAQTQLSCGTVRSRIFRARAIIRKMRALDAKNAEVWQQPTLPEVVTRKEMVR